MRQGWPTLYFQLYFFYLFVAETVWLPVLTVMVFQISIGCSVLQFAVNMAYQEQQLQLLELLPAQQLDAPGTTI
jgi:hypothetical protein